jgi:hypothetical protein
LGAFNYEVFLDFREVYDDTGDLETLRKKLNGNGEVNIQSALVEMKLKPIHKLFESIFDEQEIDRLVNALVVDQEELHDENLKFITNKFYLLLNSINEFFENGKDLTPIMEDFKDSIESTKMLNAKLQNQFAVDKSIRFDELHYAVTISRKANFRENILLYLIYLTTSHINKLFNDGKGESKTDSIDKLILTTPINNLLRRLGRGELDVNKEIALINILLQYEYELFNLREEPIVMFAFNSIEGFKDYIRKHMSKFINSMMKDEFVKSYLGVNYYNEILYYSKENFEELVDWLLTLSLLDFIKKEEKRSKQEPGIKELFDIDKLILNTFYLSSYMKDVAEESHYQLDRLKDLLFNTTDQEK